jgi:hypothetical protein
MLTATLLEHRALLAQDGISLIPGQQMHYLPKEWRGSNGLDLAMDAQPTLFTAPNTAIPTMFNTYVSPERIQIVFAPRQAAEFYGEQQQGTPTTDQLMFQLTEIAGTTSAYGDFNQNGKSNGNVNWVSRQTFRFQTFTRWGEMEAERYGAAQVNWAALQAEASSETLAFALNASYFFGITGLKLYGGMNDPALPSAISPNTKAAGGLLWVNGTVIEIYNDFLKMYGQLQTQLPALVNMSSPMVVGIPNTLEPYLARTNDFGKTVKEIIQQSFPNVRFVVIPQFATASGNLIQLRLETLNRLPVCTSAFVEKLRMHPVITLASGWEQKSSTATAGTVIKSPVSFVQMLGA